MAFIIDAAFDAACNYLISNGSRMDVCSSEPTTYTAATSTASLGNKTGLTLTGPANGATDGRAATVPSFSDGSVTADGTATHWALTDGTSTLLATGALSASQSVTSGNTLTLTDTPITIRDATAV